ncbi:MAG: 23S rRNA pseudouridine(1911/1915/1917) synthase RluD [Gammaproteobacteria bacterium]|nr:23S rRNA pseudouridine(1911/1915/1917) synthase RluD [Gammaproteobacteria bacterium]MCI0590631.1 23S rRNA pseudouridine(1911/1915/1917) synthase RluD [Gammaproteobacteria bacterium]
MTDTEHLTAVIPPEFAGRRLDQALAALFKGHSRTRLQAWIRSGNVRVDATEARPKDRVRGGERVVIWAHYDSNDAPSAQDLPLEVFFEDDALLIINKSPGVIVHPGAGNRDGTLLNALLHYDRALAKVPRAGIVHRLDKGTSGLMVVARTPTAHTDLVAQLKARNVQREYQAIVTGVMTGGTRVDAPIGRHPTRRTQMAVVARGKPAVTQCRIIRRFRTHTHVKLNLETGRTHQIRVHMAHLGYPIAGDPVYAGRRSLPKNASERVTNAIKALSRQALHASGLSLQHPLSGKPLRFDVPLPADMLKLITELSDDAAGPI